MATRSGKLNAVVKKNGLPSPRIVLNRLAGKAKAVYGRLRRRGDS